MKKLLFLFCLFLLSIAVEYSILRASQKQEVAKIPPTTHDIPIDDTMQNTQRSDLCVGVDCSRCCQEGTWTDTRCCRCCNQCQLYSDEGNTECGDLPS